MDHGPKRYVHIRSDGSRYGTREAGSLRSSLVFYCRTAPCIRDIPLQHPAFYWEGPYVERLIDYLRQQLATGVLRADGCPVGSLEACKRERPPMDWWCRADLNIQENTAEADGLKLREVRVWPGPIISPPSPGTRPLKVSVHLIEEGQSGAVLAAVAESVQETRDKPSKEEKAVPRPLPRFSQKELTDWYRERRRGWPRGKAAPTEKDDCVAAAAHFAGPIARESVRAIRRKLSPASWRKRGPRK